LWMSPFFTILSDLHFGQFSFSSLIQLSLHTLYTYPYMFGTTKFLSPLQKILPGNYKIATAKKFAKGDIKVRRLLSQ